MGGRVVHRSEVPVDVPIEGTLIHTSRLRRCAEVSLSIARLISSKVSIGNHFQTRRSSQCSDENHELEHSEIPWFVWKCHAFVVIPTVRAHAKRRVCVLGRAIPCHGKRGPCEDGIKPPISGFSRSHARPSMHHQHRQQRPIDSVAELQQCTTGIERYGVLDARNTPHFIEQIVRQRVQLVETRPGCNKPMSSRVPPLLTRLMSNRAAMRSVLTEIALPTAVRYAGATVRTGIRARKVGCA